MILRIFRNAFVMIVCLVVLSRLAGTQEKHAPLSQTRLLALVVGRALNENIVHEIETRGVSFRADETYRNLLTQAGADASVLAALKKAKVAASEEEGAGKTSLAAQEHLAKAGSELKSSDYDAAARELDDALQAGADLEAGFAMAEVLRGEEQWMAGVMVLEKVLEQDSDFPEVHTRLSFFWHRAGNNEEALREAKAALAENPKDAEAHKNAGLAWGRLMKFDAAEAEYEEALRLKPDYEPVHFDRGIMLYDKGDIDGAMLEYQKTIALNPNKAEAHQNLAVCYEQKGNLAEAIREMRDAKVLKPKDIQIRRGLGEILMKANHSGEAVVEMRELEKIGPESAVCHECLGEALYQTEDFAGAEKEYRLAMKLDPADPTPHIQLGFLYRVENKLDEALKEKRIAEEICPNSGDAQREAGQILILKKNYAGAMAELKIAEEVLPSDWKTHDLYGQALLANGNAGAAVLEFKQALVLNPPNLDTEIRLAQALEKKGDWVAAMQQYQKAAATDATIDLRTRVTYSDSLNPAKEYEIGKARFDEHLAELRAAGKGDEADRLEHELQQRGASASLSEKLNVAMQEGTAADTAKNYDVARENFKEAVRLGEQLQPHDARLATALAYLGAEYMTTDLTAASEAFGREMKVDAELYGEQSPELVKPLEMLGEAANKQKDFARAFDYFSRAVELNRKAYGEASEATALTLIALSRVYLAQKQYDKAEPYLLEAHKIGESVFGHGEAGMMTIQGALCAFYDQWGVPEKSLKCYQDMEPILEKRYGGNPIPLLWSLQPEAVALRSLGRTQEAEKIEARISEIKASARAN